MARAQPALAPADASPARIGPNAVLQLEEALREAGGPALAEHVFQRAGFSHLLQDRPSAMIDEAVPRALFETLFADRPGGQARAIARRAGELTGRYILSNRIPAPARRCLKILPRRLALPMLLQAIERHAWTFAGSGTCRTVLRPAPKILLMGNPLPMPGCVWHVGVFQTLMRALIDPAFQVHHRFESSTVSVFDLHT